ncbi:MAG: DUF4358 domain-containing protein [Butyrivibrio sp.]
MLLKIKEFLSVGCLVAFIIFINRQTVYIDTDIDSIIEAVGEEAEIDNMQEYSSAQIRAEFDINVNECRGVAYFGHDSVMDCETLLVVCLEDSTQGEAIIRHITSKREELMKLFASYAPEQYELLEQSVLVQRDKYVLYAVSNNAQKIEEAFIRCITE